MNLLFYNIQTLVQVRSENELLKGEDMKILPCIENAWLYIKDGKIEDFGSMDTYPQHLNIEKIDAQGKLILPTWVDSHTHLVYAGNRESEFVDRIKGLSYEEIASRGGGILNSAKKLQATSEEELFDQSEKRLQEIIAMGTGAVEIKSGYGLNTEAEIKMLRVAKKLEEKYQLPVKKTFLGAHALPPEFKNKKSAYIQHIIDEMLPEIAKNKLADYIDIFCEKGYFDVQDSIQIMQAGKRHGLKSKIHVNQFNSIGGIQAAVENNALSVDHLEVMTKQDIEILKNTSTIPVALPSCSLFLSIPYTPARELINANLALALASDYNPGSTPNGNMNLIVSLACIKMKLTPEEAINASTMNAAYAMEVENQVGSITKGKLANLILTENIPSYSFLPYSFGNNHIKEVYIQGKPQINP
ncbi:MAG: imidazolonepropionase [Flavobacteriaceae bacterium]|nr:imidazolonepropionase [Flavobacteriaceae bacterium]